MNDLNDLPLVCLPTQLSNEAAADLIDFLRQLATALERHYFNQLPRLRVQQQRQHRHSEGEEPF
jgi:hypothetical protein